MHIRNGALALAVTAALSAQASANFKPETKADQPRRATAPSAARPHFQFPVRAHAPMDSVLYDQSGIADGIVPAQNYQSTFDAYDSEAADDFVVTDPAGWTVSAFNIQVNFSTPPLGATYDVDIYADASGSPGAPVCGWASLPGAVDASGTVLSISLSTPCPLVTGHYWVALTANLDFLPKMLWMAGQGAAIDNIAMWRNPGDGIGTGCTDWTSMSSCVTPNNTIVGSGDLNLLFQVVGSVGASSGCNPGEICLVSTVGTEFMPDACGTADTIDVTVGDQVNFCYTITNNTGIELDYHTLQNNIDGTLFRENNINIVPGATRQFNKFATVGATNTYNSTWIAQDVPSGYVPAVESGGGNCADRIFADGFDNAVPGCGGNFVDITGTGTPLGLGDDAETIVTMPFSFNFYGTTSNQICVDNNGLILFGMASCPSFFLFANVSLPAATLGAPAIMPLWDDFDSETGDVYYDTRGSTPNRQFIVEWFDRAHYIGESNPDGATFEVIFDEDGTLAFEYADVSYTAIGNGTSDPDDCSNGLCATIGLQKDTSVFNQFSAFAPAVTDDSGIQWTATTPQVFTSTSTATVNVGAPQIVVNPNPLSGSGLPGANGTIPFAIENHGNRDLNWSLDEAAPANLHFPPPGTRFAMPLGDPAKASSAAAPIALRHSTDRKKPEQSFHVPFVQAAVPAFAADLYLGQFETFDVLAPQTTNVIAPIDGSEALIGGAFVDGDFSTFYALAGNFGSNPDDFIAFDVATGVATPIGSATNNLAESYSGLAYDSTSGKMYAASSTCGSSSHLWTIDRATGAPTLVGEITGASCVIAIAINAQGEMYGLDIVSDALFALDKSNANAALIGTIGFDANYAQDMAFDLSTGLLYLAGFDALAFTDSIYTVDLQTGAANIIGPIGQSFGEVDAIGIETAGGPCAQPQDLPWLSLDTQSGSTMPGGASPVVASIDGTGTVDGDVRAGTVCAHSDDPQHGLVEVPIQYTFTAPPPPPPPTVAKAFEPPSVAPGETSTLTITLSNSAATPADLTASLTDALPGGVSVAPTPNASSDCGGAVTTAPDSVTLDAAGSTIPAGGSCTVHVDVQAAGIGIFINTIDVAALQTSTGSNAQAAMATLSASLAPPTLDKAFAPASVPVGSPSTLTITLGNGNAIPVALTSSLTDAFPPGVIVAAVPNASTTCGGALDAVAGSDHVTLDAVSSLIPASGSCTISVDTTASNPGSYPNSIPASALQTDAGTNQQSADATLDVTPLPPTIVKSFAPASVIVDTPSTLTITLSNANATADTVTGALVDAFPSGLVVATTPNASTTCGGAVTAVAGSDSVTLDAANASIPGAGSCTIVVDVQASVSAGYANSIPAGALQTDAGNNPTSADATLDVTP